MFHSSFEKFGSKTALISTGSLVVSYREVTQVASRLAIKMMPRRVAFLVCNSDVDGIVSYVSLLVADTAVMLLPATITDQRLLSLAEKYKPAYIFVEKTRQITRIVHSELGNIGKYCLVRSIYNERFAVSEDLGLLLSTSGSTGNPKVVRLSKNNVISNMSAIVDYLEIGAHDRGLLSMPMSYSYGLSILHTHLSVGASVVVPQSTFLEKAFWDLCESVRVTSFSGVPYVYDALKKIGFLEKSLPNLKTLTQAGGPMPAVLTKEIAQFCDDTGKRYFSMYGQTEASPRMSYVPWSQAREKAGSIGRPITGGAFSLDKKTGIGVATEDQVGELIYKGPNVMLGYAEKQEDLLRGDDCEGILRTGDLAYCDSDGFYFVVGRTSRIAKILGIRLDLDEVEGALQEAGIAAACTETNQTLNVFILVPDDSGLIRRTLRRLFGVNRQSMKVHVVDRFPQTASGKISYSILDNMVSGAND